jgi:hypothetical protein
VLATEPRHERAVSIILVLAALAVSAALVFALQAAPLGRAAMHVPSPEGRVIKNDIKLDIAIVAQQETPPPVGDNQWRGTCLAGEHGWPDMPITLDLHVDRDGTMRATGTLAFVDRRTRAELRGSFWNDRFRLRGEMTEVGGLGTVWTLELRGHLDGDHISGSFIEVWPPSFGGEGARMCSFDWRR